MLSYKLSASSLRHSSVPGVMTAAELAATPKRMDFLTDQFPEFTDIGLDQKHPSLNCFDAALAVNDPTIDNWCLSGHIV